VPIQREVKLAILLVVAALIVGGFLYARRDDDDGSAASAARVARCLQARGALASVESSSTGARQVAVTHGRAPIGPKVTLESSKTYVSFLPSESEAAWFEGQLRQAPGFTPGLVAHSGNALVTFGSTATPRERATITVCLA
jgi:hypothetical protein